jgi:hypothetical protein
LIAVTTHPSRDPLCKGAISTSCQRKGVQPPFELCLGSVRAPESLLLREPRKSFGLGACDLRLEIGSARGECPEEAARPIQVEVLRGLPRPGARPRGAQVRRRRGRLRVQRLSLGDPGSVDLDPLVQERPLATGPRVKEPRRRLRGDSDGRRAKAQRGSHQQASTSQLGRYFEHPARRWGRYVGEALLARSPRASGLARPRRGSSVARPSGTLPSRRTMARPSALFVEG